MTEALDIPLEGGLTVEVLDLVLEHVETELADIELGTFGHGELGGVTHEEVLSLRRALREILDAEPGAIEELAFVSGRLDELGVVPAWQELEAHPHLLQAVRLTLEIFFRRNPNPLDLGRFPTLGREEDHASVGTPELWLAQRRLLTTLRRTLN